MNRVPRQPSFWSETAFLGLLFLAFFVLITRFVEGIYTFGLLGTSIPPEIASVLLMFAPLVLLAFPGLLVGRGAQTTIRISAGLAFLMLAISPLVGPAERMLVTGLGTGSLLVCLPVLLGSRSVRAAGLGGGLALAGLAAILLRLLSHGSDLVSGPLAVGGNLALGLAGLSLIPGLPKAVDVPGAEQPGGMAGFGRALLRYLGLMGALVLLYFGFTAPAVIVRWGEASYAGVHAAVLGSLGLFAGLWLGLPGFRARLTGRVLLLWSVLFVTALALALLPQQLGFPADPGAYPLDGPRPGPLALVMLGLALLLHPVLYAGAARLAGALLEDPPAPRALAGAASLSSLFLLLMILAHVFTTVYDYIPLVGPLLRDRFWVVTVFPGLVMALSLLAAPAPAPDARRAGRLVAVVPALAFLAALLALLLAEMAAPVGAVLSAQSTEGGSLRVMTYNLQQGYDVDGKKAYAEQLAVIRTQKPDILGIQETDTARIANGNGDLVRYLAEELGMVAYYGPTPVTGTFGIALLSRYPIENPRTFFMYSEGEQTAAILATIRVEGTPYSVLVTHLGNGGPLVQQQQVLARLAGQLNVIAMGDFNFRPHQEPYRQTTAVYISAWDAAAEQALPGPDFDVTDRIDHIFVSPNLSVGRTVYLPEGPSDHPAFVAEIRLK